MKKLCQIIFIVIFIFIHTSVQFEVLFEDDPCRNSDGSKGICKKGKDCRTAQAAIKEGKHPKICSFDDDSDAIVCCPQEPPPKPPVTQPPQRPNYQQPQRPIYQQPQRPIYQQQNNPNYSAAVAKAKQKCVEYSKSVIEEIESPVLTGGGGVERIDHCGTVEEALIVGGEKAKGKEFPHMALIGYGRRSKIDWLCGGSLISDRFVISAAHCSHPESRGAARYVKLGELDTSTEFDEAAPEVIRIIKIIDHPQYNQSKTLYFDLTLFQLERKVEFNQFIRPICLATSPQVTTYTAIASGWGHTKFAGRGSNHLLKVRLNLVTDKSCYEDYKSNLGSQQLPQGIIESQLCAGSGKGKDTCQGDSGGPLQTPLKEPYCMYALLGVTSFGRFCGLGTPGVYTRIGYYLPWIVQNVWP